MRKRALLAMVALCLEMPLLAQAERGREQYQGFDLELLAEATAQLTTMRTRDGEEQGNEAFEEWLEDKGLSRSRYDRAWNAWWERFRADPTGQLEARFHRINSEHTQLLNYGDAPDRRQEQREGVTLDTYAQIAVALTRLPGANLRDVIAKHGLKDEAQWQRVNEAWAAAMREDTSFALVQQYAALYQKYAGPQFEAEQQAALANNLANPPQRTAEPAPGPPSLEEVKANLSHAEVRERAEAARDLMHRCSLWRGPARRPADDPRAPHCSDAALHAAVHPVLLEAVDHLEDETAGFVTGLLDRADDLGLFDAALKMAARRALNRCRERLAGLEQSFAPIRDKAVPERWQMRRLIDEYTEAVRNLEQVLPD